MAAGNEKHKAQVGHNVHAWTANPDDVATGYTDIAARDADTTFNTDADNVNKVVRVATTPPSYFALESVGPTVWSVDLTGSETDTLAEVLANGNVTGGTDIVVDTGDVINITDAPILGTSGANKDYVDAQVATSDTLAEVLAIGNTSGGTDIVISTADVITITDQPTVNTDGANKLYVDTVAATHDTLAEILAIGNTTSGTDIVVSTADVITITDAPTVGTDGVNKDYVDNNFQTDNIYTASGTYVGNRVVTGEDTDSLTFRTHDLTPSDFANKSQLDLRDGSAELSYIAGNSLGGETGVSEILFDATAMTVTDTVNSKGLVYAADYSGAYTDRSLTDKAYVDTQAAVVDTLAQVLVAGNTTSGTDIIVSALDKVTLTDSPIAGTDAANKDYVDDELATQNTLSQILGGGNTTSGEDIIVNTLDKITISDAPALGTSAANKDYVDGVAGNNIYTTDGTVTANRRVIGEAGDSIFIASHVLTASNWTARGSSFFDGETATLVSDVGNGAGAVATRSRIVLDTSQMLVEDTTNTKGLIYGADYSGNFTARSLVDKAYADSLSHQSIYDTDGTLTSDRFVTGNNDQGLFVTIYDPIISNFTTVSNLFLSSLGSSLEYVTGDGAGATTGSSRFEINATHMRVSDSINSQGLIYSADYSGAWTVRSIVDKAYVDTFLPLVGGTVTGSVTLEDSLLMTATDEAIRTNILTDAQEDALGAGVAQFFFNSDRDALRVESSTVNLYASYPNGDVIFARTLSDLPTPVSTVITIPATSALIIEGTLDLGANSLDIEGDVTVSGYGYQYSIITSTNATTTVSHAGGLAPLIMQNVTILNTGTGDGLIVNDATAVLVVDTCSIPATTTINLFNIVRFSNMLWIDKQIRFETDNTTSRAEFFQCGFLQTGAVANLSSVVVDVNVDLGSMIFQNVDFDIQSATGKGIDLKTNDAQVAKGTISGGGLITGSTGVLTVNFDQSSDNWLFEDVEGSADSGDNGVTTFTDSGGQTVTINTVNVWENIADAGINITWTLATGAEKFTQSDADSGELTYNGVRDKPIMIGGSVTVQGSSGTDGVEVGVSINGADPDDRTIKAGVVSASSRASLSITPVPFPLSETDTACVQIRNTSDASNFVIYQAKNVASF